MREPLGRHADPCPAAADHCAFTPAFTLVEVLVTLAIIGVLITLLLPAIGGTRAAARSFRCISSQRSIAFDFTIFADDSLHGWRGNDESLGSRFLLETFQESQYRVDEFWGWGDEPLHTMPDLSGNNIMRCSEVVGQMTLTRDVPCSQGAVSPRENISFGFNIRLHAAESVSSMGLMSRVSVVRGIPLAFHTLDANAPLVWDVDGVAAAAKGVDPIYSGPALDSVVLAREKYWFPALRHGGKLNAAFIDGSVRSANRPLEEAGWAWRFAPRR